MPIDRIRIQNFKSIRDSGEVHIRPINVLIGSNGVGKSNFVDFFKLLNRIDEGKLQKYIGQSGDAGRLLHFGRKRSRFLQGEVVFKDEEGRVNSRYDFRLVPDRRGMLVFDKEFCGYNENTLNDWSSKESWDFLDMENDGGRESELSYIVGSRPTRFGFIKDYFQELKVFHFHDISNESSLKVVARLYDNGFLREDGSNLPAFLYMIQERFPLSFRMIEYTIRSIAPFFERFDLKPNVLNEKTISLRWIEKDYEGYFDAHDLSDGTLRFIALTTLLLQPYPPKTIILDEPELGLHPFAIHKLAAIIQKASAKSQIIISTQSVNLLDMFEPEDVLVVNRKEGASTFERQDSKRLTNWLKKYSLGELWEKNVFGGRP